LVTNSDVASVMSSITSRGIPISSKARLSSDLLVGAQVSSAGNTQAEQPPFVRPRGSLARGLCSAKGICMLHHQGMWSGFANRAATSGFVRWHPQSWRGSIEFAIHKFK
jgi:hypothetical protein